MTLVTLTCTHCKKSYKKKKSFADRNARRKRQNFCTRSCSATYSNLNPSPSRSMWLKKLSQVGGLHKIAGYSNNRGDHFSPFRAYFHSIKRRGLASKKTGNVTLEDLKKQWDLQNGICPFTKLPMVPLRSTGGRRALNPFRASIDRKDSTRGYDADNIQFVSIMANLGKNTFTDGQLIEFCHAVAKAHPIHHP